MRQRFQLDSQSASTHPLVVATVLDPQLKRLQGFPEGLRNAAHGVVRDLVNAALPLVAAQEQDATASSSTSPPAAKRSKMEDMRSAVLKFLADGGTETPDEPANDFDAYLSAPVAPGTVDVLQWWDEHKVYYPATAHVARQFLSVPATSVESERLFSATGRLISKLRSRLLPETAEILIFLNKNIGLLD